MFVVNQKIKTNRNWKGFDYAIHFSSDYIFCFFFRKDGQTRQKFVNRVLSKHSHSYFSRPICGEHYTKRYLTHFNYFFFIIYMFRQQVTCNCDLRDILCLSSMLNVDPFGIQQKDSLLDVRGEHLILMSRRDIKGDVQCCWRSTDLLL